MANTIGTLETIPYKNGLSYVASVRSKFQAVRDFMIKSLTENFDLPVAPLKSESGYFIMVDVSNCKSLIPQKFLETHDYIDEEN